ncbi:hypothetical protein BDZ94DRAFT_1324210 [Collybia nuda]|uniref:SET domain-containing protein n=1 Tax=Collybia nuda TaxID=64659 RepID=A0A9P5Y062_9AGAR|nr:hypothetical protein BDZ94DRAFT_1324210 [Collybia nuda]
MNFNESAGHTTNSLNDVDTLITNVYRATWTDFYTWEQDYCRRTLNSLSRNPPPNHSTEWRPRSEASRSTLFDPPVHVTQEPITNNIETFTMVEYNIENGDPRTSTLAVETYNILPGPAPCPPYEMCTPASRNINVGDDSEYMPFIPLVDDPTFNYHTHVAEYRYFEWQLPNRDPDLEVIVIQTVYRLHVDHKLSLPSIDESGILPLPILANPGGVLHTSRRRDFPAWDALLSQTSALPYFSSHSGAGPNTNLTNLIRDFCNNFNCTIGYCSVHMGEMSIPEPVPPTVLSDALAHTVDSPCSVKCFLLKNPLYIGDIWTFTDIELLHSILRYAPDTSPCDLAVICRKPCQEVLRYRRFCIPNAEVEKQSERAPKARPIRTNTLQYQDHDAASFTPNRPCSHQGSCDSKSNCPCFLNDSHCDNGCRCDRKCLRRWRGCNCAGNKQGKACSTSRCPCYKAHRECDPSLCIRCDAKGAEAGICKNAEIQRDQRKLTAVRMSQWGLGLFLVEPAEEEDLLIEYTGELIYEPTTLCRDYVSRHRGRTYVFQLNPTLSIDSSKAGNESRFINHSKKPNCHACVRLVNGEHRIGLFALKKIEAGSELLLNYGDSFFERDHTDGDGFKTKRTEDNLDQALYLLDQHSSDETYSE